MKFLLLLLSACFSCIVHAQKRSSINQVTPGEFVIEPPTLICAGFEWYMAGDDNRNATVEVSFRKKGSADWRPALPLLRLGGEKIYGHDQPWVFVTQNMFAGSIFGLDQGTEYECRFVLTDKEGVSGKSERIVNIKTKSEPKPYDGGNVYHVYPPGYSGEKKQPAFTGLNEAYYGIGNTGDWWNVPEPRVQPGDVILVHKGRYQAHRLKYADSLALDFDGAYVLTQKGTPDKPITIKAAGDGEVIFDGDGSYRLFDVMAADYHYFEGLTIRNTDIAFYGGLKRVMGCSGLTVKNCKMVDIGIGVVTYSADSKDFYIADNVLVGRHDPDTLVGWYGLEKPALLTSYTAIKVYGQSHVVCHNSISYFHDGICVDTHGLPEAGKPLCSSIDFYRNDIFAMADDFIESDGGVHNIRVFENRGFNSYHSALSAQPMFGGPVYFFRNLLYNVPGTALKYTVRPSGILTYQNTFVMDVAISNFSNGHFRNNLFIGFDDKRAALSATTFTRYTSLDYDGYRKKSAEVSRYVWRYPAADSLNNEDDKKMTTFEFKTLREFTKKTGYETHGIELNDPVFVNVKLPDPARKGHVYQRDGYDFTLRPGSKAIDAGCLLPTINDNYAGKAPDLGAVESGKPLIEYGPRK